VIITARYIARIMYAFMYLSQRLGEPDQQRRRGGSLVPGSMYPGPNLVDTGTFGPFSARP
jgi:hypothetical protein